MGKGQLATGGCIPEGGLGPQSLKMHVDFNPDKAFYAAKLRNNSGRVDFFPFKIHPVLEYTKERCFQTASEANVT